MNSSENTPQVLVAGIGNIFLGDDAFGVEVAQLLQRSHMPEGVSVKDFGIRSFDLAYALLDPWDAVILVDAMPRGEAPGTLYTIEVDLPELESDQSGPDAHSMNPVKVLQLAQSTGQVTAQIYVVGCEPEDCGGDEGRMGLTPAVESAVAAGAQMVQELAARILAEKTSDSGGAVCSATTPPPVIAKPAIPARNRLSVSSEPADCSRDNPALRNNNSLGTL